MNKRDLKLDKYGISKKRYKELCGFCEQYPEWKAALKEYSYVKGVSYSPSPKSVTNNINSPVEEAAIKNEKYLTYCNLIETVAKEVDADYWQAIINAVCYNVPLAYMIDFGELSMSRSVFFDRKRLFFYLLDKRKG